MRCCWPGSPAGGAASTGSATGRQAQLPFDRLSYRGLRQAQLPVVKLSYPPTLALVVNRDREIEAFKPVSYHTIRAAIQHEGGTFMGAWKAKEDQAGLDSEGRLVDTAVADALVASVKGQPIPCRALCRGRRGQGRRCALGPVRFRTRRRSPGMPARVPTWPSWNAGTPTTYPPSKGRP